MKKTRKLQLAALLVGVSAAVAGFAVANDSVTAQATETPVFAMEEGAAVRTKSDDSGIRWITKVDKAWYDNAGVPADATVQFGTFVTSASNVSSIDDLDEDFTTEKTDLPCTAPLTFTDGTFTYYSAITFGEVATESQKAAYAAELVARSYMKYSTDGENWTYEYADSNDNQRCIRAVALEALEDPNSDLDANEQTTVQGYVGNSEDQVTMDGGDGVCETTAEPITGDYAVAYKGAKKVGTFTEGTLTLNADFGYNQDVELTLFDVDGNYAKTATCKYITQYIDDATEFTDTFEYAVASNSVEYKTTTATGYYILTTDIQLDGTEWKSNKTFSGTLDGNGKKITGLNIYKGSTTNYGGLFRSLQNAKITNLAVVDAQISGQTAGVFAFNAGSVTFENVYVSIANTVFGEHYATTQYELVLTDQSQKAGLINRGNEAEITLKNCVIYMPENLTKASGFVSSYGKPTLTIENSTFIGGNGALVGTRSDQVTEVTYTNGDNGYAVVDAVGAYKALYGDDFDTTAKENGKGWTPMQIAAYEANHPLTVLGTADFTQTNLDKLTSDIVVLTGDVELNNTHLGISNDFTGVFDGQGHTISEMTTITNAGLFNKLKGSVKNLSLKGTIAAAGGLLAYIVGNTTYLENVYLEPTMDSTNYCGAVARWIHDADNLATSLSMKNVVINVSAFKKVKNGTIAGYMSNEGRTEKVGIYMDNCHAVAPEVRPLGCRNSGDTTYVQVLSGDVGAFFWEINDTFTYTYTKDEEEITVNVTRTEDDGLAWYTTVDALKEKASLTDFQKTWLGISQAN